MSKDFEEIDEQDFADEIGVEMVSTFVTSASKSAAKLTQLIVENNKANGEKVTTEEIYEIYHDSFAEAINAIVKHQVQ